MNLITKNGTFTLNAIPMNNIVLSPNDNSIKVGCKFDVTFKIPNTKTKKKNRLIGIMQLIRPLTYVSEYHLNKTKSGWAVDKSLNRGNRANLCVSDNFKGLIYGMSDSNTYSVHNSYSLNKGLAKMYDTPTELLIKANRYQGRIRKGQCTIQDSRRTKFASYVIDLEYNRIYNEGMLWGYDVFDKGNNTYCTLIFPPRIVRLNNTKEHIKAITHFLDRTLKGINVLEVKVKEMIEG